MSQNVVFSQTAVDITGPDTVCVGAMDEFTLVPTNGLNYYWQVSQHGQLSSPVTASEKEITWITAGLATIIVKGITQLGDVIEQDSLNVQIMASPQPVLSWDKEAGCLDRFPENIGDSECLIVCQSTLITFSVEQAEGSTYEWSFLGETPVLFEPDGNSCEVMWDDIGWYTILVTETDKHGCIGTTLLCIEVIIKPTAIFNVIPSNTSPLFVCENVEITFDDQSDDNGGPPIISWFWDFGDGNTSTDQNPSHTFTSSGIYEVFLTVTNACYCTDKTNWRVVVVENQEIYTIECPTVVCEGQIAFYSIEPLDGIIEDCLQYHPWSVQGGTIVSDPDDANLAVLWDDPGPNGMGYIIFDREHCNFECHDPLVAEIPIVMNNGVINGSESICTEGSGYLYTLPRWPGTLYNWEIVTQTDADIVKTDQPNEINVIPAEPGEIILMVNYLNTLHGCGGTARLNISVLEAVEITGPAIVCAGTQEVFEVSISNPENAGWTLHGPDEYSQTFIDSDNFTAYFPEAGIYQLYFESPYYCSQEPMIIEAKSQPEMPLDIYGPDSVCQAYPYTFSTGPEIFGTSFNWSLNNGVIVGSSSGSEIGVYFSGGLPDTLSVWHIQNNLPTCTSDTLTKILHANSVHFSVIGKDTVCPSSFETYTTTYENAELYEWSIIPSTAGSVAEGDGTNNIVVLWNHTTTNINAQLVARLRQCNTFYQEALNVVIVGNPVLNIVAPNEVCRDEVFFPELQSTPVLSSGTVNWNFGDQNTATGNPTQHTYTALQITDVNLTISVTVINPNGCEMSLTTTTNILVKPAPVAYITPPGTLAFCEENEVNLNLFANLQSGFEPTETLEWYETTDGLLVDCDTPFSCNPLIVTDFGTYFVRAIGENGCAANSNVIRIIQHCPTGGGTCEFTTLPEVSIDIVLEDCGNVFLEGSYDAGGMNPYWTYSGQPINIFTTATTFEADYTTPGLYMFTYNVEYLDDLSNVCTLSVQQTIIVPVIADMKFGITCNQTTPGYDVTLYDHSEYFPGTILNFSYFIDQTLENGPTSNTEYTHHLTSGTYNLAIEVGYNYGSLSGQCPTDVNIDLPDLPVADFSFSPETDPIEACEGIPIAFTNQSTPTTGLSFLWDFKDGAFNTQENPFRVYDGGNIYEVSLLITNAFGCTDQTALPVNIVANPLFESVLLTTNYIGSCANEGVWLGTILPSGAAPPFNFMWFKNNIPVLDTDYEPALVHQTGAYWVTVINENGCRETSPANSVLLINEPTPVYIESNAIYCAGSTIVLQGIAGSDAEQFQWFMNQSLEQAGSSNVLEIEITTPGVYEFELWAGVFNFIDGTGYCYGKSEVHTITVIEVPDEPTFDTTFVSCDPYHFQIEAISNNPGLFTWSNGKQGDIIDVFQGGAYKATFNDGSGCYVSSQIYIPKDPVEYLWIFPSGCHKVCDRLDPPVLTLFGPIPYFEDWEWGHSNQGPFSGQGHVDSFEIDIDGTINLSLDNGFCERTSDNLELEFMDCECEIDFFIRRYWEDEEDGLCVSYMEICFDNNSGYDMVINISPQFYDMIYVPSTFFVPVGTHCFNVQTISVEPQSVPYNTNIYLTGLVYHDSGEPYPHCFKHDQLHIDHLCDYSSKPEALLTVQNELNPEKQNWIKLYPNPSTGIIQLSWLDLENVAPLEIQVFNVFGIAVFSKQTDSKATSESLDLALLPAGIYFLRITHPDFGSQTHRLVIQR